MGKREVFKKNMLSITHSTSIARALKGWKVLRIVSLNKKSPIAHCEICGTRFRAGAIMRHQKFNIRISVGGTCAEMIHLATLRIGHQLHNYQQSTWKRFDDHYEHKIARGSWMVWIINNAPQKYASIVADLRYLHATRADKDMEVLIKYHDRKRLYPSKSLVDARLLKKIGWRRIPAYLTMYGAKKIMDKVKAKYPNELARQAADVFYASKVKPYFNDEIQMAWNNLNADEKRSALAIIKFKEKDELAKLISYEDLYETVKIELGWPLFVWNSHIGLCIMNKQDYRPPDIAKPMIYPSRKPTKSYYALRFFRSLQVKDAKNVGLLESKAGSL